MCHPETGPASYSFEGVLPAGHTRGPDTLLQETRVVDDQRTARVTEMRDDVIPHVVDVPIRPPQQPLFGWVTSSITSLSYPDCSVSRKSGQLCLGYLRTL